MDRKGIIAIVLCMIVLIWWQLKTQKEMEAWRAATAAQEAAEAATVAPSADSIPAPQSEPGASPSIAPQTAPVAEVPEENVEEVQKVIKTPAVEYVFTNKGGGIATARLLKHQGREGREHIVLNTITRHPIGALLDDATSAVNPTYTLKQEDGKVVATRQVPGGPLITKTFSIPRADDGASEYLIELDVTFSNFNPQPFEKLGYFLHAGTIGPVHTDELPYYLGFDWADRDDLERVTPAWFEAKHIPLLGIERAPARAQYEERPGNVVWAGLKNQYYTSLLTAINQPAQGVWAERLLLPMKEGVETQGLAAALAMPGFKLGPQEKITHKFTIYVGPKQYGNLKELGANQAELMDFGIFKLICILLLQSMNWLEPYFSSYAIAIIVLTFIVRGLLWPVQGKANASMKRMQALQPKMTVIREKFKDDPTRMNQEVMKLYKDYGVNPFAGCLPMLIQIPIFFGFYSMLGTAVELRDSHFLWVNDLSLPDTIGTVFGFPINILPILMAATMVLQMQLTPKSGDALQQRIFMFMPLIFVVFTYNFASALALYYTVQNLLSIVQLYLTRNQPMPELVKRTAPAKPKSGGGKRK